MAMLCRPLAFHRETCVFTPVGLEKPLAIFEPFLVYVISALAILDIVNDLTCVINHVTIRLVRPTNTPNLVEIGSQVVPLS